MAFGIGTNTQKADAGFIKGKQRKMACKCWFTSEDQMTSLMLKIEDKEGEIRTVRQIQVLTQEEKRYAEGDHWSLTAGKADSIHFGTGFCQVLIF